MKDLKNYINESLLDDDLENSDDFIINDIIDWIKEHYSLAGGKLSVSKKPNKNGKYVVNYTDTVAFKHHKFGDAESITNGNFVWGTVKGSFHCTNLRGLESLEDCPRKVGKVFNCGENDNLISLEGAPEYIGGAFRCDGCKNLKTLKGVPEKIGGDFYCIGCSKITSLEGAPKEVGGDFYCYNCGKDFDKAYISKFSDIKGEIITTE